MSKKIVKPSPIDFKAKLIVYGLPEMNKREIKSLMSWISKTAKEISKHPEDYYKRAIFKLMK